ncbi:piggyBac transposable element-derived protein 4-like [Schistocerca piceifrons]|uniref:piggyBac transposable element-derived protein 4-like n=1 Tax=Schistocerca piceifrons TaxID=274613 RepID=UPI001F5EDCC1|nr:piggyBac transposable element-derived protein 4-like [Schistocerca piceifrons]
MFKETFYPYEKLCLDESLMLFKGHLKVKQHIPAKGSMFGIKIFIIFYWKTNYILDFIIYVGAQTGIDNHGMGVSGNTVATLPQTYLEKGHTLFVNNWYTSPDLFCWLYDRATNTCGAVRQTRKEVPAMEDKLKKGEITSRSSESGKVIVLKWHDKKEVWMLSTYHKAEMHLTSKRDRKSGDQKMRLSVVIDYNKSAGLVDQSDMLIKTVDNTWKSSKWHRKLFLHILDTAIFNAFCLYQKYGTKMKYKKFHFNVIRESFATFYINCKRAGGAKCQEYLQD